MWGDIPKRPWQKTKLLQDKRLNHFLNNYLYPFSKHYRNLFQRHKIDPRKIKRVEDLKYIPFTTKEEFLNTPDNLERYRDFLLIPDEELIKTYLPKKKLAKFALLKAIGRGEKLKKSLEKEFRPIFLTLTTGTTNQPIPFLYTQYDLDNLRDSGFRLIDTFGIDSSERAMNIFPYAPHLAFWQTVFAGFGFNVFILSTGGGKVMGTDGNVQAIAKIKPSFLIGVPSYIYHVVRRAQELKIDISSISKITLGASRVPPGFKEKIAQILYNMGGKKVFIFGTYGFTEARSAWGECPTEISISSGYHLYPDKEIFEVIDPKTGEAKKEGEDGELVYTNIDARGSCVLRYRTGDFVKGGIIYSACPHCKKTVPRISSDISRLSNIKTLNLSKIKGSLVNFDSLAHILDDNKSVAEWQIEIRKKNNDPFDVDELALYLAILPNADIRVVKEEIRNKMMMESEISPNEVIVLSLSELIARMELETANKEKRIVDKRPL